MTKRLFNVEAVEGHCNRLATLFDGQIETLKSRSCPQAIVRVFHSKRDKVLSKAAKMDIPDGHIPFIPVIPRSYIGIYGLMDMIRIGENRGYTSLDPNEISNNIETPKEPYFIYDVEDGKDMLGKSPKQAKRFIKKRERYCITAEEGIVLCIHTNVLSTHYVNCTGSMYKRTESLPNICLDGDRAVLNWHNFRSSLERWGSASCHDRE